MGWGHMAGTVFGITLFGLGVERELGTPRYAFVVLLLLVSGVFELAIILPQGSAPMAGGSLLGFGLMGIWLAIFYRVKWQAFPKVAIALEIAAVATLGCWLGIRTTPSEPSLFLAIMWHVVPLMAGWLGYRMGAAVSRRGKL
jgi:membrane associated rhomboid family serine protease